MALCNAHYYATRDPLGAAGDFTTAPEISQMFGELIGLWAADLWLRAGKPDVAWVELGPGRGTLSADALRAIAKAVLTPPAHLVETSPLLREAQRRAVPGATHHDGIDTLPTDRPLIVVANEFFDALPIRQIVRTEAGWRERMVDCDGDRFVPTVGAQRFDAVVPDAVSDGDVIETSPASVAILRDLAARIVAQGGALLAIDYGYEGPLAGDTLQALRRHRFADPFAAPGEQDLTAHVDFAALAEAAHAEGAVAHQVTTQGALLGALGITARAATLARAAPNRQSEIEAAWRRLCAPDAMGTLFKALAITAPGWPMPGGFG
ncbi:SAM-dependent methyltransferase [Sphingomonas sp. CGMCC 1.13654]|uniref:SAM-dependent methyltransferase n=1 Tax=Sphingomonas chungangi TaxID=2683589 RepID=A0A838L6W4_9SPHN|nr:SAM-dependent methyltransferase [Sphingomonas chungangi]MBA2934894.1 SAM-dependent methyltransferase [Sphingomonas chungangi]MVW58205.1 class I SAM-dependent methyltransferase [Sphingomonas chungangi]